jgi:hypothetical protein
LQSLLQSISGTINVSVRNSTYDFFLKCSAGFGFAAALLETSPFIGLIFSISNQIGAAMWAHGMSLYCMRTNLTICAKPKLDLEKRQHWFGEKKRKPL